LILYVSKCNDKLNSKELNIEELSEYLCLNPIYPVTIKNKNVNILMDSGAYQDREKNKRLTNEQALERQLKYEIKLGLISQRIVAYDYMSNVEETIIANNFLNDKRKELTPRQLVFMVQGDTTREYIYCLTETLKIIQKGDCIGFGGVALSGKINDVKFKLLDAFKIGLPLIYKYGIKDIHIFGVGSFKVLKQIAEIKEIFTKLGINNDDINITCDTASFEIMSTMGNVVNTELEKWEKVYTKIDKYVNYHPCDLTINNTKKAINIIGGI